MSTRECCESRCQKPISQFRHSDWSRGAYYEVDHRHDDLEDPADERPLRRMPPPPCLRGREAENEEPVGKDIEDESDC